MPGNPKISVVMSAYNEEKYVKDAIESILAQSYGDYELIIINDGSTDRTREIVESFKDPRILLVNQENRGLIRSLNRGIGMARGEYIARHDADDISRPERFAAEAAYLDLHGDVALVGTQAYHMTENGRDVKAYKAPALDYAGIKECLWRGDIPICHGTIMCRKKCLEEIGLYREKLDLVEEYDLFFRIAEKYPMVNIEEPFYRIRMHEGSICAVNRVDINRRYEFVKRLAEERKAHGTDSLDRMTPEEIDRTLDEIAPVAEDDKRRTRSDYYCFLADGLYVTGSYPLARKRLFQALGLDPFSSRAWGLMFKLLVRCILPAKRGHV